MAIDAPVRMMGVMKPVSRRPEKWISGIGLALAGLLQGGFTLTVNASSEAEFDEKILPAMQAAGIQPTGDAYEGARRTDSSIVAVAPVGRAWQRAWATGVAAADPYAPSVAPLLWYGIRAQNDPPISRPDYLHPGVLGAYLSALVLFQQISGVDVRTLGAREQAAAQLGIAPVMAASLQAVASDTVRHEQADAKAAAEHADPCASP